MSTEPTLSAIASDVQRIGEQTTQITKWITGNGDPKKGLLWQVADLRTTRGSGPREHAHKP